MLARTSYTKEHRHLTSWQLIILDKYFTFLCQSQPKPVLFPQHLVRGLHPTAQSFQAVPSCPVGPRRAPSQPHRRRGRAAVPARCSPHLSPTCPKLYPRSRRSRPPPSRAQASSTARPGRAGPGAALTRWHGQSRAPPPGLGSTSAAAPPAPVPRPPPPRKSHRSPPWPSRGVRWARGAGATRR